MIKPIQFDAVNWVDGMKISQKHFDAQANYILDSIRDIRATFTPPFSYGLLPLGTPNQSSTIFDVFTTISGDVEISIHKCQAITPSGFRVELSSFKGNLKALIPVLDEDLEQPKRSYYLIIFINPYDKIPFGRLDAEETPPRYPYVKSSYRLDVIPIDVYNLNLSCREGNEVIIGKVSIQGEVISVEDKYIPPCTSLVSHGNLFNQYTKMLQILPVLEKNAVKILQKESNVKQNTRLMNSVKILCQALIHDIGNAYFFFRNIVPNSAPIYFIERFSQIAIHLLQVTKTLSSIDLEELLNYISEWSEVMPNRFLSQLSRVAEIKYIHEDCESHICDIQLMISVLEGVFLKLSELDYIGQRKENIIVNEMEVTLAPKGNRGWSVLD